MELQDYYKIAKYHSFTPQPLSYSPRGIDTSPLYPHSNPLILTYPTHLLNLLTPIPWSLLDACTVVREGS